MAETTALFDANRNEANLLVLFIPAPTAMAFRLARKSNSDGSTRR